MFSHASFMCLCCALWAEINQIICMLWYCVVHLTVFINHSYCDIKTFTMCVMLTFEKYPSIIMSLILQQRTHVQQASGNKSSLWSSPERWPSLLFTICVHVYRHSHLHFYSGGGSEFIDACCTCVQACQDCAEKNKGGLIPRSRIRALGATSQAETS